MERAELCQKNTRRESRVFGTTHMLINSHLAAVLVQEKCPESDCFEE